MDRVGGSLTSCATAEALKAAGPASATAAADAPIETKKRLLDGRERFVHQHHWHICDPPLLSARSSSFPPIALEIFAHFDVRVLLHALLVLGEFAVQGQKYPTVRLDGGEEVIHLLRIAA